MHIYIFIYDMHLKLYFSYLTRLPVLLNLMALSGVMYGIPKHCFDYGASTKILLSLENGFYYFSSSSPFFSSLK